MPARTLKPLVYGLYGERDQLLPDFLHIETIEFRTTLNQNLIQDHIHLNLFQVFILQQGIIEFTLNKNVRTVEGPIIILVPENTSHGMKVIKKAIGKVITLSSELMETYFDINPIARLTYGSSIVLTPDSEDSDFINILRFSSIVLKEFEAESIEKRTILQGLSKILLSLIYRISCKHSETIKTSEKHQSIYFNQFLKSIKLSNNPAKKVTDYSAELGITPSHLNRTCNAVTGNSALQLIHAFFIREAEKKLFGNDLPISEIAYLLNFEDPAYFSRFFKKHTGLSPREYKKKLWK